MGMSVKSFIIAFIFITMFSIGFFTLIADSTRNYGIVVDAPYNETMDNLNTAFSDLQGLSNKVQGNVSTSEISSTELGLVKIGPVFSAAKLIFIVPNILITLITDLSTNIGLPEWVIPGVLAVILIFVAFALIRIIFKVDL